MRFTLDANAAQSIGGGLGSIFKAAVLGPMYREQAEREAQQQAAVTYLRNMQGNQAGATARKALAETTGLDLTNQARQAPIDASLPEYLQAAQRLFQMTGDTNMDRFANAGTALQTQAIRDQALANVGDVDTMNRLNTLAKPGEAYMPFRAVGDTGVSLNQATGTQDVTNAVLNRLFSTESGAKANRDNAAAGASAAQARRHGTEADLTGARLEFLRNYGRLPGSGATGEDATNAKTRNQVIAEIERQMPGLSPEEFAAELQLRLERRGMVMPGAVPPAATATGGANKNPAGASGAPKMQLPQGMTAQMVLDQARAAIVQGKDPEAVKQRLREMGVDPEGL